MKIADIIGIKSLTTIDVSLYFQDSSVSLYRDSSGNLYFDDAFNNPINLSHLINDSVKEASLGSTFKWTLGILDVSDYASKTYIDASLNLKTDYTYTFKQDASIALKTNFTYSLIQDASIALKADKSYVDASLVNIRIQMDSSFAANELWMIVYAVSL